MKAKFAMLLASTVLGLCAISSSGLAKPSKGAIDEDEVTLTVWIDDMLGKFDFQNQDAREGLLENAFRDAARKMKWKANYKVVFSLSRVSEEGEHLSLRIQNWSMSPSGNFNCTVSGEFLDLNKEKRHLGTFDGQRMGIDVFNRRDIGEHYQEAAEAAFVSLLKKLEDR